MSSKKPVTIIVDESDPAVVMARQVLRAWFGDSLGFKDMTIGPNLRAVKAVRKIMLRETAKVEQS